MCKIQKNFKDKVIVGHQRQWCQMIAIKHAIASMTIWGRVKPWFWDLWSEEEYKGGE